MLTKMNLLLSLLLFVCIVCVASIGLKEEFTWSRISYRWPRNVRVSTESRYRGGSPSPDSIIFEENDNYQGGKENVKPSEDQKVPSSINYQYENNIPMAANVWKNKLFISVPRRRAGIPSTLNYVPLDSPNKHNVPLIPYPNWKINLYPNPSPSGENLVSVYRVAIDPCDRMWMVDTGIIEILGNATVVRPPSIVIIDLNADKIIHRYEIPPKNLKPTSALANIAADVNKDACGDAFVYIPDLGGYGIIAYSLKENKSWRVSHNYFHLEPLAGEFYIAGHYFQWNDGVFSVELTEIKSDGYRDAYFHSMAGTHIYKVSTRVLRNESLATRSYHGDQFQSVGDRGSNFQSSAGDIHKPSGIMFLGLVNQNALGCWNTAKALDTISIVQKNDQKMIYPSDVKVSDDKVYVLTNAMPEFLYGKLDYDQVNFRVWSNTIKSATEGTKCV